MTRGSVPRSLKQYRGAGAKLSRKKVGKFLRLHYNFFFSKARALRVAINFYATGDDMTPDEMREKAIDLFKKRFH